MKLAFLFRTAPHGNAISREGLDALLAATAFCDEEEIGVFFIDDGVLNLLDGQNPELLLQKDFIRTFKLLDLYDIEQRFVCADSLDQYHLQTEQLIISAEKIDRTYLHAARLQFEFKGQAFDVFTPPKEGEWWHRENVQSQIQKFGSVNTEPKK